MKRLIAAFGVVLIAIASAANADEITITSGTVIVDLGNGSTTAVLLGTNTDIVGSGTTSASITFGAGQVGALSPNPPLNVSGAGSTQQIGGVMFPGSDQLQGSLSLTTAPFATGGQSGSLAFFQTPFSLSGSVSVFNPMGTLLGTSSLNGTGNASIIAQATTVGTTGFDAQHISYVFGGASATTTPEPSTVVLLALVLGVGWFARRRLGFAA